MTQIVADEQGMQLGGGDASAVTGEEWIVPSEGGEAAPKGEAPAAPERPEYIPEKFWTGNLEESTRKMSESYANLEKARGEKPTEDSPSTDEAADDSTDETPTGDAEQSAIDTAMAAFEKDGKLSDEHYASLEQAGIGRETVDAYIQNLQATSLLAHTAAGGEENFKAMTEWAAKSLTPAEIEAFNTAVQSPSPEMVAAVQGLAARFAAESSTEPTLVSGDKAGAVNDGFGSKAEMTAAMADPRYKTDPAYRAEVERKMVAADRAGVNLWM